MEMITKNIEEDKLDFVSFSEVVLNDFYIAHVCREASILGRIDVLSKGKASFGIFGDGKEVPQIAMAKVFKNGDWRSGYYRDLTFMVSSGMCKLRHHFSQLYAHADTKFDPFSGGRQMNSHFATRFIDEEGNWLSQVDTKNSFSDISSTGGQMARSVGLANASKYFSKMRDNNIPHAEKFTKEGKELCFTTVGNGTTSEGVFWETVNTCGVLQSPIIISILDNGYGISVENKLQTTKQDIYEVLKGFQRIGLSNGVELMKVKGWDYPNLVNTYAEAEKIARDESIPVIIHVSELTQPQGHSTSGTQERYKSAERLEWEKEFDCLVQMEKYILGSDIATIDRLEHIKKEAKNHAKNEMESAWTGFRDSIDKEYDLFKESIEQSLVYFPQEIVKTVQDKVEKIPQQFNFKLKDIHVVARKILLQLRNFDGLLETEFYKWYQNSLEDVKDKYHSKLYCDDKYSYANVSEIKAEYPKVEEKIDAWKILRECFKKNFEEHKNLIALGEDIGKLGGVNQCFRGLQKKFGKDRIIDTGIREATIVGEGIGLASRGFKPIIEIQYLDYIYYPLFVIADDLANLTYRSKGGNKAPVIIRTRGHRLEGIWHSGSPMGMLINALRGMVICVPRDFTQACGIYNTLFKCDDPALVIECLFAYRFKEVMPSNVGEFTVPLGIPEKLNEGNDVTVVSYGACLYFIQKAVPELEELGITIDVIDVQTLLPFDIEHSIVKSIEKTNKVIFIDEDVPGGASAFMMQKVMEEQKAFEHLDAPPKTLTAKEHRPPYGEDGNYFTKPGEEDIVESIYKMMHEYNPQKFPLCF